MSTTFQNSEGYKIVIAWLNSKGFTPFTFQVQAWHAFHKGHNGMVVAPTGFGKTYSIFLAVLISFMNQPQKKGKGLQLLWVTPLRALAKDIAKAMQEAINEIGLDWTAETRNGDTDLKVKARQSKAMPEILIVTPESLHLLLAQKNSINFFKNTKCIAVDEWHELLSTKRGVMLELALAYLNHINPVIKTWGISATIGNIDEALQVLVPNSSNSKIIKAKEKKKLKIHTVLPNDIDILPWAGHLGNKLVSEVVPIILESKSTLIFTNTRSQSELWYQLLLDAAPELAGQMALHHGSIDAALRSWIEDNLSSGKLKAVVATSSLDLGVDFKPVDTVIQIGSSKGIARFIQRAGRSGHAPHEVSNIHFVPTHALEVLEAAALKEAVHANDIEDRLPLILTYDVLVQFLVTIALGAGFEPETMYNIISSTHAFQSIEPKEWQWCLLHITQGGAIGSQYEEYHKVTMNEAGLMVVNNRRIAMIHRMNIGVIVSDAMMRVKFVSGGYIGMLEEYFIAKLNIGDKFILAGRVLELANIKDLTAYVRSASGKAITPSWMGGRLPLSANLSYYLRKKMMEVATAKNSNLELDYLKPIIQHQEERSHVPKDDEFLVECIHTREGYHLFAYPFEGRLLHEIMSSMVAYRISKLFPVSFSMAMNDYGFELFTDTPLVFTEQQINQLFSKEKVMEDTLASINATEMARHKFRDIAVISGMVIQKIYGKQKNNKSLHASSSIIFNVLEQHDPHNLLLRQAYNEVFFQQIDEPRLLQVFERISKSKVIYKETNNFTPLSFPIKVDSIRQSLSNEALLARIEKIRKPNKRKKAKKI